MTRSRKRLLTSQFFWAGIFVAAFILWAWLDSIYNYSGVLAYGRRNGVGFWQEPGRVRLAFLHGNPLSTRPDVGYERSKRTKPGHAFPGFGMIHSAGMQSSFVLYLPYWGILGGHVLLASCLIAWRCRNREVIVDAPPAR